MKENDYYKIWPCVIIADRYSGVYSGGLWLAFDIDSLLLPKGPFSGDMDCMDFWYYYKNSMKENEYERKIGIGNTPNDAYNDLLEKLEK